MSTVYPRLRSALERSANGRFYPALVASFAFIDYFIPGSPSNTLLVASVLPKTGRWPVLGLAFAIGCAGGAMALATLLASYGQPLAAWVGESEAGDLWRRIEALVEVYGLLALGALALSPFPVRIAVAVLALTGASPLLLGAIVFAGRVPPYLLIAWLASRGPAMLARFGLFSTSASGRTGRACK